MFWKAASKLKPKGSTLDAGGQLYTNREQGGLAQHPSRSRMQLRRRAFGSVGMVKMDIATQDKNSLRK